MKYSAMVLVLAVLSCAALAEEGGEHEAKKPPPKPSSDLPVAEVLKLPIVKDWKRWTAEHNGYLTAWGEAIKEVEGKKCWGVAVGESRQNGRHVWRHFCVPVDGGDVWVESVTSHPEDEVTYTLYDAWVKSCGPTEDSEGKC